MNRDKHDVEIGLSLADSELVSYSYQADLDKLVVQLLAYNLTVVQFEFSDLLLLLSKGAFDVSNVCENIMQTGLFQQALETRYTKVPEQHPYKHIQFFDTNDEPSLEIVCGSWEAKLIPHIKT